MGSAGHRCTDNQIDIVYVLTLFIMEKRPNMMGKVVANMYRCHKTSVVINF